MLKLISDKIAVIPEEAEKETKGGIILPDAAQRAPQEGVIAAVGPGKISDLGYLHGMPVKAGDRIAYSKYGGTELKRDGVTYLIISPDNILAVLEEAE
jgi:chaperonin GroES